MHVIVPPGRRTNRPEILPGFLLCTGIACAAYGLSLVLPNVSPLIIAIGAGVLLANITHLPQSTSAGIDFSAKKLLRVGIVLLGLRLVLADIARLGAPMLLVIVAVVAGGITGTVLLGRLLRVPSHLALLIACGFSICGAAAVAGAAGATDPDDEAEQDTVTAVALVVVFGTLMIPLLPLMSRLAGLDTEHAGLWAGGSIHEIAQVVAAGGVIGGGALTVAVVVKLARVLLMAPVVTILSVRQRRTSTSQAQLPPVVPPFVVGFVLMVLLRSFVPLPDALLQVATALQTGLLAAAMFALGCGVRVRNLAQVGVRPFALAALSTVLVATIAFTGVALAG